MLTPTTSALCVSKLSASWLRIGLLSFWLLFLVSAESGASSNATQSRPTITGVPRQLVPGERVTKKITDQEAHIFQIHLTAGQYLRIVVEQIGVDIKFGVYEITWPPGLKPAKWVDHIEARVGSEELSLIADTTNNYGILVRTMGEHPFGGSYVITVQALRTPTARDRELAALDQATQEGYQLLAEGKVPAAEPKFQAGLTRARELGDDKLIGRALYHLGFYYIQVGKPLVAKDYLDQGLPLLQRAGDEVGEGLCRFYIVAAHLDAGNYKGALESGPPVIQTWHKLGDKYREAQLELYVGKACEALSQFPAALDYFKQAQSIAQGARDRVNLGQSLANQGNILSALGRRSEAVGLWKEALKYISNPALQLPIVNSLCQVYFEFQNDPALQPNELFAYTERAVGIIKTLSQQGLGDHPEVIYTFINLGMIMAKAQKKEEALGLLNQALRLAQKDSLGKAYALYSLGVANHDWKQWDAAADYFKKSLEAHRQIGERKFEAACQQRLARVARERGQYEEALSNAREGLKIVRQLRGEQLSRRSRSLYFATLRQHYDFIIDLLAELDQKEPGKGHGAEAFHWAEDGRARILLDTLQAGGVDLRRGVEQKLIDRERLKHEEINRKGRELSGTQDTARKAALERELEKLWSELDEIQTEILKSNPRAAALADPPIISAAEARDQLLDDQSVLLEYWLGERECFLWVVSKDRDRVRLVRLPRLSEVGGSAPEFIRQSFPDFDQRSVRQQLEALVTSKEGFFVQLSTFPRATENEKPENKSRREKLIAEYPQTARALSQILLSQVAAEIKGKRLIIVADGILQSLPFAALAALQAPQTGSYIPLITEHEIDYLPSASTLALIRKNTAGRPPAPRAIAVFADPVFSQECPEPLPRLTNLGEIVQQIKKLVEPGQLLDCTGFEASRANALNDGLRRYRHIAFLTHGEARTQQPELSRLIFSTVDREGHCQDGDLPLHEIYNLTLPADLIMLGGCKTTFGGNLEGEGLISLMRGFFHAGAAQVIATLWEIKDVESAKLISRFYERVLGQGQRPAAALREAQLEMWRSNAEYLRHPYFWASFVSQGEWQPLAGRSGWLGRASWPWLLSALAGVAALSVMGWFAYKRRWR